MLATGLRPIQTPGAMFHRASPFVIDGPSMVMPDALFLTLPKLELSAKTGIQATISVML